jgi:hypothetical protein
MTEPALEKILFVLPGEDMASGETLWAKPISSAIFELMNVPLLAYGVNLGDLVNTEIAADGRRQFRSVADRGGHRTFRASVSAGPQVLQDLRRELERTDAVVEMGGGNYLAVDAQNAAIASRVLEILERGEEQGLWEFEESGAED